MDRSFWSLHDHPTTFIVLGLPTFGGLLLLGLAMAIVIRSYDLDAGIAYIVWAISVPVAALTVMTFFPLPCCVFAWSQAQGNAKSPGECYAECFRCGKRLLRVIIWMVFSFFWWVLLLGLPLLILWPRTCLAPMVALFENQRRIFWRSRRLMHEDHAIYVLAGLYLLLTLILSSLIFLPRLILFGDVLQTSWTASAKESIWAFELFSIISLLTGVAVSWCVALTLFYHDLRFQREGEGLQNKIEALSAKYNAPGASR